MGKKCYHCNKDNGIDVKADYLVGSIYRQDGVFMCSGCLDGIKDKLPYTTVIRPV